MEIQNFSDINTIKNPNGNIKTEMGSLQNEDNRRKESVNLKVDQ